ncbi:MAG: signal peptidase II [Erysipelotrichaceae bacterium]|nr:signal peptidase II [Erysipelotrichaceae bacterium]
MKKSEIALLFGLFALDRLSKSIIDSAMKLYESKEIIKDFFYITYCRNTGAAWSILEGKMWFFYIITIVALGVMGYFLIQADKKEVLQRLSFVCMIAGTLGNFFDRLTMQYVIDFLDFYIFGYNYPVFNVADICLCVGVGLLALDVILHPGEKNV